ncbi:fumarate hydratase [archaeon SCG-AAA382B04]|nr:fumarate hydratase [archaeon SCG-AAA382B04]
MKMEINSPLSEKKVKDLSLGQKVEVSGDILTARDKAHQRILNQFDLPFELDNQIIYHCGPLVSEEKENYKIISAGPTTSTRLSEFIPQILEKHEIRAFIGKGGLKKEAIESLKNNNCLYLSYTGGAGALAAKSIKRVKDVFWLDLGIPEAVWKLEIERLPCIVSIDTDGQTLYHV